MKTIATVAMLWLISCNAFSQPQLVQDINPGPEGQIQPFGLIDDNVLYFKARHPDFGIELWVSDGTAANTRITADLLNGTPSSNVSILGVDSSLVYFSAIDDMGRRGLRSIGFPGAPVTEHNGISSPSWLGKLGGKLLMRASNADNPGEIFWINNAGPPELWVDINQATLDSNPQCFTSTGPNAAVLAARANRPGAIDSSPHWLIGDVATELLTIDDQQVGVRGCFREVSNGYFFFGKERSQADPTGNEPWSVDRVGANATLVQDINPGRAASVGVGSAMSLGYKGEVYFAAESPNLGVEVWKSNGAGAQLVEDIAPGTDSSDPIAFLEFNAELYFGARTPDGPQLWKTDGSGATLVATIDTNPNFAAPWPVIVFDDHLLFRVETEDEGLELWATNGRVGRARLVADINPGPADGVVRPITWVLDEDRLLFFADDGEHGLELWRLDSGYLATLFPMFANGFESDPVTSP